MKNKTLKIATLILAVMTLYSSCDFSTSTSSLENTDSQTTISGTTYNQTQSDFWSHMFEDYWNYMNVNYVFWDLENDKNGEYQKFQTDTDWDEIYVTYSLLFKEIEDEDDLITRNHKALTYFQTLTSTLIDHHYYMYFKNIKLTNNEPVQENNYYSIILRRPADLEVSSRNYYDQNYLYLDFSQYVYNNFKRYDNDGITTGSLSNVAKTAESTAEHSLSINDNFSINQLNLNRDNTVDIDKALEIIETGYNITNSDSNENSIILVDRNNLSTTITSNLSNVKVFDTSNYTNENYKDNPLVIISALFDSDGDTIGDTPYLYFSNFFYSIYTRDSNVTEVLDNFWALVYNTNGTGKVKKIIFDLRHNPGGFVGDLKYIVAPLINSGENMAYCYTQYKAGDNRTDYTPFIKNYITGTAPTSDEFIIDFPIIVLSDIFSVSMSELTILALKEVGGDDTILMGQRTWGGTGPLSNKIFLDGTEDNEYYYVYTSANATFDLMGNTYEGIGISPKTDEYYNYDESEKSTISHTNNNEWGNDFLLETAILYGIE
jgi:hypothetical protein